MKTWIRRTAIGAATLVVLAGLAFAGAVALGDRKLQRRIDVAAAPVAAASDPAAIARGGYLFRSRGCADCHGGDGAGRVVVEDGGLLIRAPNITRGTGGVVAAYRPVDWVRTIRHGVKPDGRPALIMPSEDYNRLTDADLAAIVGYVGQLAPVAGQGAEVRLPLPMKALYAAGMIRDAAEKIDHRLPPATPVAEAVTAEHGGYVANSCIGCHGADLAGGKIPGAPPSWPPAARLAPGPDSAMATYPDAAAFQAMFKTGKRPDGSAVSPVMPFAALREMSEVDVQALYLHLKTLPARR